MMRGASQPSSVDRPTAIASAALVTSVGALFFNLMPLLVGALADERGFDEAQLGVFAAAGLAGSTLATASAPLWVRRVRWRRTIRAASSIAALGYALAAGTTSYAALVACMVAIGVAVAVAYAPALASLADTRDPDRSMGVTVFVQVSVGALCALAVPVVEARFGVAGLLGMLGVCAATPLLLAFWVPDSGRERDGLEGAEGSQGKGFALICGLAGVLVFYVAVVGVWSFLELIGNSVGVADDEVAVAITLALLVSGLGALAAAVLGQRVSQRAAIGAGAVGLLLAYGGLHASEGYAAYLVATIAMNATWNFSISYQMGLIAVLDVTGRYTVLVTAVQGLGGVLGPALAGLLAQDGSYGRVLMMGGVATVASLVLFQIADRVRREP